MIAAQERKHVLFDDIIVKWIWEDFEIKLFRVMWKEGADIAELSKALKCNRRSIALLVMDQAEKGFIKQRRYGLHGK